MAAAVLLVASGVESAGVAVAGGDLQRGVTLLYSAKATLGLNPAGWTPEHVTAAAALQARAQPLLQRGCARLAADPALRLSAGLPTTADQTRTIRDLCTAAVAGGAAFGDFILIARAYAKQDKAETPGQRLMAMLAAATGPLADADARLGPAVRRLEQDQRSPLAAPLAARLASALRELRPLAAQAASWSLAARFLPAALGEARPMTYLVLLENPSEQRPSGGLIGSVGTITIDHGSPASLDIRDYDSLNPLFRARFPVPDPLGRYLAFYNNALELGDAGWDPDFPTTARLAEAMYASAVPSRLEGTIAVDPYAVAALLTVTGPVQIAGYGTFTSTDFFQRLNTIINARTDTAVGKRILPEVAQQVLQAVLAQPADAWPQLLSVIQTQAAGRHVQIFLHDAAAEKALAAAGYDGAILSPPVDDYLMVVDANVGATKGDWYTHKQLNLYTEVYPGGMSRHQLRLSYDLPPPVDDADRLLNPGDGAYLDYVRVYLPEQASIAGFNLLLDGKPTAGGPDRVDVEHGKKVVGAFFNLPRGHRVELDLTYEVPLAKGSRYSFQIQKQAGVLDLPTTLAFSWPGGRETRRLDLVRDLELTYRW